MRTIHSLYYHNPNPDGFERMIKYYKWRGYRFISINELRDVLNKKINSTEKLAFISLDDGWQGNLRLIPVIERYNVPICIFVAMQPIESGNFWWEYVAKEMGYKQMFEFKKLPYKEFLKQLYEIKQRNPLNRSAMTTDELIQASKHPLVSIQSHTVNHPILTNVPLDVLNYELDESKKQIENLLHKNVFAFSYPNGSLTSREVDACKRYYDIAFTTEQRNINSNDNLLLLPRYALTGDFKRDLLKVWGFWKWIKKFTH